MSEREPSAGVGRLFVVATPIGNLDDVTLRALRVLREADTILAEDTRRTRILLSHHGVEGRLRSFHAHSEASEVARWADAIASGARIALVSDAGSPVVSDPGGRLVDEVVRRGLAVESVPGPSALTAALGVAGIPADDFRFSGFLPRSGSRRRRALARIVGEEAASVLFESPQRLRATLEELAPQLGSRPIAICRELTKLHEEVIRGTAREILDRLPDPVRGEITIVVGGAIPEANVEVDEADVEAILAELASTGLRAKDAARTLAERTGLGQREAYRRVVERSRPRKHSE